MGDGAIDSTRKNYIIGFTVHEAKELSKTGQAIDPLVVVRALGREYKTQLKRDKLAHAKFEETYSWSDIWLTDAEFAMSFIEFELQAASVFWRNEAVGMVKVQLAMVRQRRNHTFNNKTLQLSLSSQLTAWLKVSVFCYTEGDDPPKPEEDASDDGDVAAQMQDLGAAVVGTGQDQQFQQFYNLFVMVHRAEDLGGGKEKFSPFVEVEFGNHTLRLPDARNTNTIAFDECFRIPVVTPLSTDAIVVRIWNKKTGGYSDELIVQGQLNFSLLRMHAMLPKWFNFYGFDKEEVTDIQAITGSGEAAEVNTYLGRLLISGRVQKVKQAPRPAAILKGQNILEDPPASQITFAVDVFEVSGCPGVKAYVTVSVGTTVKKTKSTERDPDAFNDPTKPGRFGFQDGRGRISTWTQMVPTEPDNQLDLLVSVWVDLGSILYGKGYQRIGFKRVKISEIKDWDGDAGGAPMWAACRPMAHLPTSIEPGAVLMSISKSTKTIKERGVANVKPLSFELRAYCCMARNLNPMKDDHLPNPHLQISCAGKVAQTYTMKSTTAPTWNQCLKMPVTLQCTLNNLKVHPEPIQIVVYDEEDEGALAEAVDTLKTGLHGVLGLKRGADVASEKASVSTGKTKKTKESKQKSNKSGLSNSDGISAGDIMSKMGAQWMEGMADAIGDMQGDVMANKRRNNVVDGRRVIGRAQVNFRKLLRPIDLEKKKNKDLRVQWMKIKGGMMGSHHVGDILIGFELMKSKYANQIPVKPMQPTTRECTLSIALMGLRALTVDMSDLGKPKLMIVGPAVDALPPLQLVHWEKRPESAMSSEDQNRKWSKNGLSGFEFLNVVHLTVKLPKSAVHEPSIRFRLYSANQDPHDDDSDPIAEGRLSLAEHLPWVKHDKAKAAIAAKDKFEDSDEEETRNGCQVSDAEDGEIEAKDYVELDVGNSLVKVAFNSSDVKSFPPIVSALAQDSAAASAGVRVGDWLVGYKTPDDQTFKLTGMWSPAQAMEFVKKMDTERIRPLHFRFRRKDKSEVTTWFTTPDQRVGLELVRDASLQPPQIKDDVSDKKQWKKQGVKPGWYIVDVNGVDLKNMAGNDPKFQKLLQMRPACITCRPFGKPGEKDAERAKMLSDDTKWQRRQEVMLDGTPSAYLKELEHKMKHTDGELANTRVSRPFAVLPPVLEAKNLNMRLARGSLLDVRGVIKLLANNDEEDDEDDRSRPNVDGKLEDTMENSSFHSVPLFKGSDTKGQVKMSFKLVYPADENWVRKIKDQYDPDVQLYEETFLRQNYKHKQPSVLRVRSYIIRGLNISSASDAGHGNPYLFFNYGANFVHLDGHRQMETVEPRFFRTEERDVQLPEEAIMEVGLYDWKGGDNDQMIGKTVIDLEDRWHAPAFKAYMKANKVPIEYRPLINDKRNISKGSLEMWMEILDAQDAAEVPLSVLFQPPPIEVEVRAIVWGLKDVSRKLCLDKYGEEKEKINVMVRCQMECKSFVGPQAKEQETDEHHGCETEAEFNWRFVYSRIQITKGVNLDCFLHLSLWERYDLQRPMLLCESMLDMKTYCKKVASERTMVQIESELPLRSQQLHEMMAKEAEDQYDDEGGDEDEPEEEDQDAYEDGFQGVGGGEAAPQPKEIPPAALMTVMVQVIPQTEASTSEMKAGLGRADPNRNPALPYPKTGRGWQDTFPTAAAAIDMVIHAAMTGKARCKMLVIALLILSPIWAAHYFKKADGCPLIMKSCYNADTCKSCYYCADSKSTPPEPHFCFYSFMSADSSCFSSARATYCNVAAKKCECEGGTCDMSTTCIKPRIAVVSSSTR